MSATPIPATWRSKARFYEWSASTATPTTISVEHSPTSSTAGRFRTRMIAKASHIENARHRQRHSQLLSRMARSRHDLVVVQSGACGEHEPVCRLVDQPDPHKPGDRRSRRRSGGPRDRPASRDRGGETWITELLNAEDRPLERPSRPLARRKIVECAISIGREDES